MGKYQTSIKYYRRSITIAQSIKYEPILTYAYNGIAVSNKYLSNYDSAIYYYKQALEIDKKSDNNLGIAIDYHNIGSLYFQWKQFDQALEYFVEAKEIYTKVGSKNDLSLILNNIGTVYREKGKYDLALEFFNQALSIDSTTGIEINMAARFNNIGQLYAEQNIYRKALSYYDKSLLLNRKLGHRHNEAVNLHNIGKAFVELKAYEIGQNYFEDGLQLADSLQATSTVIEILNSLTDVAKQRGNYKEALTYHVQYSNLKDSTFKEKNQMAMADLKTRFDIDKKDQEIILLNNKNEFHQLEVKAYRTKLILLIIGIVLISFLSFFLVVQYLHKHRAYKKLVDRSREIAKNEKQFKELLNKAESKNTQVQNGTNGEEYHPELLQNLLTYFEDEKAYLNQDVTIKNTAEHLKTNPKYISQAINANFNKNFNAFVNEYRIKLAMKYLANGVKKQYSIEGISDKVGFHSKSAFNASFKKITGVTPSFYIKSIKEEITA